MRTLLRGNSLVTGKNTANFAFYGVFVPHFTSEINCLGPFRAKSNRELSGQYQRMTFPDSKSFQGDEILQFDFGVNPSK